MSSIANRIVELCPGGVIDRSLGFEECLADQRATELRDRYYHGHVVGEI